MKYSREEIQQYIVEEEVKFIRMAFCDIYGKQKNISIMADEFGRAYEHGIAIDASAVPGFGDVVHSDLLLFPDTSTRAAGRCRGRWHRRGRPRRRAASLKRACRVR